MHATLEAVDVAPPATAMYREVMLLYEDIVDNQKTAAIHDNTVNVVFPTNSSQFFDNIGTSSIDTVNQLTVTVMDLGRVVRDPALPLTDVCALVEILSALVVIDSANGTIISRKEYKIHTIMSNLLISFAQGLHAGNEGLRMLKHAVQHAVDPLMPCFLNERLHIGTHAGNLYIDIDGNVHASMKARNYRMSIAFSLKELLTCHCDCLSGSEGLNRHSCGHCLVKPFQLLLLLYDGLAENILIELQI